MICTYWCWLIVTGERDIEQDKRLEPVRSVQCAVSRKTLKYSHSRHCLKLVWPRFWWSSRWVGQCQVTKFGFCTGSLRKVAHISLSCISTHYSFPFPPFFHKLAIMFRHLSSRANPGTRASIYIYIYLFIYLFIFMYTHTYIASYLQPG